MRSHLSPRAVRRPEHEVAVRIRRSIRPVRQFFGLYKARGNADRAQAPWGGAGCAAGAGAGA
jgi:hypothetical protein